MKSIKFLMLSLAALLTVSCGSTEVKSSEVINITQAVAKDATPTLFTTLMDAEYENGATISFEKGEYHFYPDFALEQFCYISNHNDVLARIAFPIKNKKNITIEGNGSTFIFHGRMIPFWVEGSEDITLKDITVDFADTFHAELLVVNNNMKEHYIDFQISDKFPYEIRNDQLIFTKGSYEHNLGFNITFDPKTSAPTYNTGGINIDRKITKFGYKKVGLDEDIALNDEYGRRRSREYSIKVKELKQGLVRVYGLKKPLDKGCVLVCKGENGMNRFAPGLKGLFTKNLNIENVTVHHAGGMGFLFENCENVDLYKCKVTPSQGRIISTTADATHFVGCSGKVALRECVFESQLDDATNVHGAYQRVINVLGKNAVGVRMGHYQQAGFALAKPGDKVGIVRLEDSFEPYSVLTIKSVDFINGRYNRIVFEEELPAKVAANDLLENLTAYPDLLIEGCTIRNNRARGVLISTPVKTVIKDNYFSTQMSAIFIAVESSSWLESGSAANVLIENNTFEDCVITGRNVGVILFHTDDETPNTAFKNIDIVNNKFNQFDNLILTLSNIDGLRFKGNTITNSGSHKQFFPNSPFATIKYCTNVEFADNKYTGKAKQMIKMEDKTTPIKFN